MSVLAFHMSLVLRLVCVAIFPVELVLRCVANVRGRNGCGVHTGHVHFV